MQNTTTAATAAPKKQITCGINQNEKDLVKDLSAEFTRPAAVKGAPDVQASEREVLEMALAIATNRRFKTLETVEEYLDIEENDEGECVEVVKTRPGFVTIDLFEEIWQEIIVRDYSTPAARGSQVAAYKSQLEAAQAELAALKAAMAASQAAMAPVE